MSDYGHDLEFGTFITPVNRPPRQAVELAQQSERLGFELASFQDHPYQPAFHDTWTLMSYIAAATSRIRLTGNVHNLPLRQPAVLARPVASLDLLTGGRIELGLGAGGFWDAIEAMGGTRLTPGDAVTALAEAIDIIRGIWNAGNSERLVAGGAFHRVDGAKRGPRPAHEVPIWVGAYKPRMLRLIGTSADGWLPSLSYLGSLQAIAEGNAVIDDAATAAGRDPRAVRRLLNIGGQLTAQRSDRLLTGPPDQWAEQLAAITLQYGVSAYILGGDDPSALAVLGQEVAPAVRELVAAERA